MLIPKDRIFTLIHRRCVPNHQQARRSHENNVSSSGSCKKPARPYVLAWEREPLIPGESLPLRRNNNAKYRQKRCGRKDKEELLKYASLQQAVHKTTSTQLVPACMNRLWSLLRLLGEIILGFSSSLCIPSMLLASKLWDTKQCCALRLAFSENPAGSNTRLKQCKPSVKPRRRAYHLHDVRPEGSSSLKVHRGLTRPIFSLLLHEWPMKRLRLVLKWQSIWLVPMHLRPILRTLRTWPALWRLRLV